MKPTRSAKPTASRPLVISWSSAACTTRPVTAASWRRQTYTRNCSSSGSSSSTSGYATSARVSPGSTDWVRFSRKVSICQPASRAVVWPVERATWIAIDSLSRPDSTRPARRRRAITSPSVSARDWPMSGKPMARQKRVASSIGTSAARAAWYGV